MQSSTSNLDLKAKLRRQARFYTPGETYSAAADTNEPWGVRGTQGWTPPLGLRLWDVNLKSAQFD